MKYLLSFHFRVLVEFCKLRAQSVRRQLYVLRTPGTSGEKTQNKVDASDLSVLSMGVPDWVR